MLEYNHELLNNGRYLKILDLDKKQNFETIFVDKTKKTTEAVPSL